MTTLRDLLGRVPPDRPAVRLADGREVGYGRLAALADHVTASAPDTGGASVGLCLTDPVELVAWSAGLLARGTSAFLVHPDLPAAELAATADHEGAAAVVTTAHRVPDGFTGTGSGPVVGGEVVAVRRTGPLRAAPGSTLHFYTSGTSGHRKGAVRTQHSLCVEGAVVSATLGYRDTTRVLCAVPLCHAYGFALGVMAVLSAGGTLVAARPMTGSQLAAVLPGSDAEVLVGVPVLFDTWARGHAAGAAAHRLRLCVSSGAALPDDVARRFADTWGVPVAQQYGLTECGAISVDLEAAGRADCVGLPYPGVRVRRDPTGELVVSSAHAASGYVRDDPDHPSAFTPAGVRTGDLGERDERGRLHLVGRRSEVVNVHGEKVDPIEVEQVLRRHPLVDDAAVVGVPTRDGDQWVAAFVVGEGAPPERELAAFCAGHLVAFKVPRRFIRLTALPRTATGKVRRTELRDLVSAREVER